MRDTSVVFLANIWWLLPAAILISGVTYLMYAQKNPWATYVSRFLGTLRVFATLMIFLILLNPLINHLTQVIEKPIIALVVDHSLSMMHHEDSIAINQMLMEMDEKISAVDFEPWVFNLETRTTIPIRFDAPSTNLNQPLDVVFESLETRNLAAVVLISDGLYNQGLSPSYRPSLIPIHSLGLGDTVTRKDLAIKEVRSNQVVYQGNRFPIEVYIDATGYTGIKKSIILSDDDGIISKQKLVLSSQMKVTFEMDADKFGLQHLRIKIPPEADEINTLNNEQDLFIEIVEGKEKILLVAPAPHPDIRAIRMALAQSENYQTQIYIPGLTKILPRDTFDVIIHHQAFSRDFPKLNYSGSPIFFYFLSKKSNLNRLYSKTNITIEQLGNQQDVIKPVYNENFTKFELNRSYLNKFNDYPTLKVPYGSYDLGPHEILLQQRVGNLTIAKPVLSFFDNGSSKYGVFYGTGIWSWRLQELAMSNNAQLFDQIILKSIQYLSVQSDKRKFMFNPISPFFQSGDLIQFTSESYNDIYEPIAGNRITLKVFQKKGEAASIFNFIGSDTNKTLNIGTLEKGIYYYEAVSVSNGKSLSSNGQFIIKDAQLERTTFTANHDLLKDLADHTGGQFYHKNELELLIRDLKNSSAKSIIHSLQDFTKLIDLRWLLFVILGLFSLEWFFRKYLGSY
ncbi:hypothetical protein N8385_04540 [Cyclobacteriaceae bacterium]|nr:hypothetical protein [Cyclobacteriaceae bacterium]|tara:strand:- start:734 stop:2773 length:2040 start_codon:yes stop_codon:yes gene_type:complete